jgi:hypothetical protein
LALNRHSFSPDEKRIFHINRHPSVELDILPRAGNSTFLLVGGIIVNVDACAIQVDVAVPSPVFEDGIPRASGERYDCLLILGMRFAKVHRSSPFPFLFFDSCCFIILG